MDTETENIKGYKITRKTEMRSVYDMGFALPDSVKEAQTEISKEQRIKESYIANMVLPHLKRTCVEMEDSEKLDYLEEKFNVRSFKDLNKLTMSDLRRGIR